MHTSHQQQSLQCGESQDPSHHRQASSSILKKRSLQQILQSTEPSTLDPFSSFAPFELDGGEETRAAKKSPNKGSFGAQACVDSPEGSSSSSDEGSLLEMIKSASSPPRLYTGETQGLDEDSKSAKQINAEEKTGQKKKCGPASIPIVPRQSMSSSADLSDGRNSGRWTEEEHERFLSGLRKYGKDWPLIKAHVQTRDIKAVVSHAQKFHKRLLRCLKRKKPRSIEGLTAPDSDFFLRLLSKRLHWSTKYREQRENMKLQGLYFRTTRCKHIKEPQQPLRDFIRPSDASEKEASLLDRSGLEFLDFDYSSGEVSHELQKFGGSIGVPPAPFEMKLPFNEQQEESDILQRSSLLSLPLASSSSKQFPLALSNNPSFARGQSSVFGCPVNTNLRSFEKKGSTFPAEHSALAKPEVRPSAKLRKTKESSKQQPSNNKKPVHQLKSPLGSNDQGWGLDFELCTNFEHDSLI